MSTNHRTSQARKESCSDIMWAQKTVWVKFLIGAIHKLKLASGFRCCFGLEGVTAKTWENDPTLCNWQNFCISSAQEPHTLGFPTDVQGTQYTDIVITFAEKGSCGG